LPACKLTAYNAVLDRHRPLPGVGIYPVALAARLTGVAGSTLASWRASGVLKPGLHLDLPRVRLAYTYDELGAILLIHGLRRYGRSMDVVRKAVTWFRSQMELGERWAGRCVRIDGGERFAFVAAASK